MPEPYSTMPEPAPDATPSREELDRLLGEKPGDAGALRQRAGWRFLEKDWEGVVADFEAALALEPKAGFEGKLAEAYARVGDAEAAEREFARELSHRADDPHLLWSRADLRRHRGDLPGALEDMLKASALLPGEASAWAFLSRIESDMGRYAEALVHVELAMQGSPGYWPHYLSRATIFFRLSRWADAEEDFTLVLDHLSDSDACQGFRQQAHRHRGWCRFLQRQDGAFEDLQKAVHLDPLDTLALCYRGVVRCARRDKEARSDFDAALRIDPGLAMAYAFRGDYHLHIGADREAALEDYRKAIELEPGLKDLIEKRQAAEPRPAS